MNAMKENMEEILSKHGGTFKPDFGIEGEIEYEKKIKKSTWMMLLDNITGKAKDQRMKDIITKLNQEKVGFSILLNFYAYFNR